MPREAVDERKAREIGAGAVDGRRRGRARGPAGRRWRRPPARRELVAAGAHQAAREAGRDVGAAAATALRAGVGEQRDLERVEVALDGAARGLGGEHRRAGAAPEAQLVAADGRARARWRGRSRCRSAPAARKASSTRAGDDAEGLGDRPPPSCTPAGVENPRAGRRRGADRCGDRRGGGPRRRVRGRPWPAPAPRRPTARRTRRGGRASRARRACGASGDRLRSRSRRSDALSYRLVPRRAGRSVPTCHRSSPAKSGPRPRSGPSLRPSAPLRANAETDGRITPGPPPRPPSAARAPTRHAPRPGEARRSAPAARG